MHAFKYCQYCGRQIDAGAADCPYCGIVFNPYHREYKQNPNAFNFSPKDQAKIDARRRVVENKAAGIACCPKCGSTSLTANKKGFGIGKAVIGASVAGPIGLVAGNVGRQKVIVTCLNCGHQFKPGK